MGNLTLPTPVVLFGGLMCLLAGALIGYVAAPDSADTSVANVASYDTTSSRLCLSGDAISTEPGGDDHDRLCGTWRHTGIVGAPEPGQKFRFVVVRTQGHSDGQQRHQVLLYGDVVR